MDKLLIWLQENYQDILTWAGFGGTAVGGGLVGKKWKDKDQDKKIKQLEDRMDIAEKKVNTIETDLKTNFLKDQNFREKQDERHKNTMDTLGEIKEDLKEIRKHLLSKV